MSEIGMPKADGVEYRLIPEAEGYCVGSDGSVWSSRRGTWRAMKQTLDSYGYLVLTVFYPSGRKMKKVHRLICEAFHGPCPDGLQCCHNDGRKTNNRASNLRWGTPKENKHDQRRHGTLSGPKGEANWNAKLTEGDVLEIRRLAATRELSWRKIAAKYQIALSAVGNIVKGRRWKHLAGAA